MSPLIVWAGVVALAIICFTIVMVAAVLKAPGTSNHPRVNVRGTDESGRRAGEELASRLRNLDEPQYGIKDKDTK